MPGSCIHVNSLFLANAGLDIFQDALIYILPMRMLYQIQIPRRQKIALMVVFAVGGFVVITGMLRFNYLIVAQNPPDPSCKATPPSVSLEPCHLKQSQMTTTAVPSGRPSNLISAWCALLYHLSSPSSTATFPASCVTAVACQTTRHKRSVRQEDGATRGKRVKASSSWRVAAPGKIHTLPLVSTPVALRRMEVLQPALGAARSICKAWRQGARMVASGSRRLWSSIITRFGEYRRLNI